MYLLLVLGGWISIYASTYNFDHASIFDFNERSGKQLLWIALSMVIAFVILMLESDLYERFAYPMYAGMILLLIATIFLATDVKGSGSWLKLGGGVNIQPAEFGKFVTALALAKLFDQYQFRLNSLESYMRVGLLIGLPFIIIVAQRETGTALVYTAFLIMLYREGMSGLILFGGFVIVALFILVMKFEGVVNGITPMDTLLVYLLILGMIWTYLVLYAKKTLTAQYILLVSAGMFLLFGIISFFGVGINFAWIAIALVVVSIVYMLVLIFKDHTREYIPVILMSVGAILFSFSVNYVFNDVLEPHQQVRIKVALGLEDDPRGVGYNVNQSKIAIGSGGLIGKGFLNGTQTKLKYVPEQDTDFIYCTIGEEEGFAGSAFVVIMFMILILRIIYLAERQRTIFSRVYGYCVAGIILFHLLINVGMVLGITPVIGIPLPFFSYGGSSLWGFSILLFIFLRLDVARLERL